jgi:hypothetical protein
MARADGLGANSTRYSRKSAPAGIEARNASTPPTSSERKCTSRETGNEERESMSMARLSGRVRGIVVTALTGRFLVGSGSPIFDD